MPDLSRRILVAVSAGLMFLGAGACSDDDDADTDTTEETDTTDTSDTTAP